MILILIFLILSVAFALLWVLYFKHAIWQGIIAVIISFLLLNLIYILIWGLISLFVNQSKPISRQSKICRAGCCSIASLAVAYFAVKVHITGEENLPKSGRFLYVSNHRSGFDPLVVISKLKDYNISFISKPENMKLPVFGRLAYGAGYLAIDRENNRNALETIVQATEYLKNGICSIGLYPEGTRSRTGELLPFKRGCFKIAQRACVPIVVAVARGGENVFKRGLFGGSDVYLDIIETIPAEKVCAMSSTELAEYTRERIGGKLS